MKYINIAKPIVLIYFYFKNKDKDRVKYKRDVKGYDSGFLFEKLYNKLPKRKPRIYFF